MNRAVCLLLGSSACIENGFQPVIEVPTPTPPTSTTGHGVFDACESADATTYTFTYPARQDCPWGQDDNLVQLNEFNRARVEEERQIVLPSGTTLCGVSIASSTTDLLFDDHVTIAIGDVVLVGGGSGYPIERLPLVDGLYRYDWAALAGTPFADRNAPYWCLGDDSVCEVPTTEILGSLNLQIDEASTDLLVREFRGLESFPLVIATFGDDDTDDCAHSDIGLEVTVAWADAG
jgi:hypothetical protein